MSPVVDELLYALRDFSNLILPTLGAITLIALTVLFVRLTTLVKETTLRIKELQPTIQKQCTRLVFISANSLIS